MSEFPVVTIVSPTEGSTFAVGEPVPIEGHAVDPQDGDLIDGALQWVQGIADPLAQGESFTYEFEEAGPLTITVTATDSDGNASSASVHITIQ